MSRGKRQRSRESAGGDEDRLPAPVKSAPVVVVDLVGLWRERAEKREEKRALSAGQAGLLAGLRSNREQLSILQAEQAALALEAAAAGATWAAIGAAVGLARQNAYRKFSRPGAAAPKPSTGISEADQA